MIRAFHRVLSPIVEYKEEICIAIFLNVRFFRTLYSGVSTPNTTLIEYTLFFCWTLFRTLFQLELEIKTRALQNQNFLSSRKGLILSLEQHSVYWKEDGLPSLILGWIIGGTRIVVKLNAVKPQIISTVNLPTVFKDFSHHLLHRERHHIRH